MALDIRLQEIASGAAGIYFLVYDNSQTPTIPQISKLRLYPINTEKGPVNSLVFFDSRDFDGFKKVFGDINRKDERNGNFSIRTCLHGLENGPILVINLRKFNDFLDTAGYLPMPSIANGANGTLSKVPYQKLFNTDRLWVNDARKLLELSGAGMINIANVGNKPLSVYIKRAKVSGYDISIKNYYAALNREMPGFVNGEDLVSDTMIDVYVFGTDLSDNMKNMLNENYGHLFTEHGLKPVYTKGGTDYDSLSILSSIADAGFINKFTGSLIPGLIDTAGNSLFIENMINAQSMSTGLVFKFNEAYAEDVEDWEPNTDAEGNIIYANNGAKKPFAIDLVGHSVISLDANGHYTVPQTDRTSFPQVFSYVRTLYSGGKVEIDFANNHVSVTKPEADQLEIPAFIPQPVQDGSGKWPSYTSFITATVVPISVGDKFVAKTGNLVNAKNVNVLGTKTVIEGLHTSILPLQANGEVFPKDTNNVFVYPLGHADEGQPVEFDPITDAPLDAIGGSVIPMPTLTEVQLAALRAAYGKVYNIVNVELDGAFEAGDMSVVSAAPQVTFTDDAGTEYTLSQTKTAKVKKYFDSDYLFLNAIRLDSYKPRAAQFTDGTPQKQNEILDIILQPGILRALKGLDLLKFRYVVDCFKSFIETNYKYQLTTLAKEANAIALCNEPFVEDMMKSTNPFFRKSPEDAFDVKYLETGGNRAIMATNSYAKPKDGDSFGAYFGPGILCDHFGTTVLVPPAGLVSKAFLNKFIAGKQPFIITAGEDGIISGTGVKGLEYAFDDEERKYLEHVGYNAIIYKPRKGMMIYGNNTAQISIKTDLSKIHVRELIIHIQEQMKAVMEDYIFKFNDYANRLAVKTRADSAMNIIKSNGGVYYFENICDGSNNTEDVISNDMGILDTRIVSSKGAEKWVHRTYLEKGGNIAGFEII